MLPNELLWQDGEFWKWQKDDDCHGLYCQKYPLPYIERLLDQIEKWADQKEAKEKNVEFEPDHLAYRPFNEMQIEARIARRKAKRRFPPRL